MDRMEKLLEGNLNILLMLLQEDPLILDRVTLDRYGTTPLHIASMLGHKDFVNKIITQRPRLAIEPDLKKRLPLHIASAKGHIEIVKLLLSVKPETCLVRDHDGRNPLHLAAIKGRYEVVKELVGAQPHAAKAMVQQETILHLCVKHNQVEVLKLLTETIGDDHEFTNTKDVNGNTILHLAVADKQIETVEFLVFNTTIEVNASNTHGETSMDILAQSPRDMKYQQIKRCLTQATGVGDMNIELSSFEQDPQNSRTETLSGNTKYDKKPHLKKDKGNWLEEKRNTLMVVASLIATMAFQAGTNPPGGVWQEGSDPANTNIRHEAGYAIMPSNYSELYKAYLVCNTVGFVSTLSIILLLISGLPFLKHRVFMWVLIVIMWIATTSMSITYWVSIVVLTPRPETASKTFAWMVFGIVGVWIVLMTLVVVGHTIQIIVVTLRKFRKRPSPRDWTILRK